MKNTLFTIAFLCAMMQARSQNFYGDMESWRDVHVQYAPLAAVTSPQGWYSTDSLIFMANYFFPTANFKRQVFKTTDAHSGLYAAKLVTMYEDTFGMEPALLTNGMPVADSLAADPATLVGGTHFYGGTAVSQRLDSISAWIKYLPNGADTAKISIVAVLAGQAANGTDSVIGSGKLLIAQTYNTYTQVAVQIQYVNTTVVPDLMYIFITSSHKAPKDSSTLFVDDIEMETTGINNIIQERDAAMVYPNPSRGVIHISSSVPDIDKLVLYNACGEKVYDTILEKGYTVNASSLDNGIYFYNLLDKQGATIQRGKIDIMK